MRVLVTRPTEDARHTQSLLRARGHDAVVAPLMSVHFHDGPQVELTGIQAIVATSANGVRAFARRSERRDLPLFAVGPQTAEAAREAGFASVRSADGDAAALTKAIPTWASAENGSLLHASGADGEGRLAEALRNAGFSMRTEHLYAVKAVHELPSAARDALVGGFLDAVLLYSPRSARIFADCVKDTGLAAAVSRLIGVCISQATAAALSPLALREIRIAKQPNQDSLLDCLG
jgi:uroporphyrinogen-III synthase